MDKRYALISTWDKEGLEEIAKTLSNNGYTILSTGGTESFLKSKGIPVTSVSDITEFPEILEGRVKTLHPVVHAGILADRTKTKHMEEIKSRGINPIDFLICNLYPFKRVLDKALNENSQFSLDNTELVKELIENIDIGGVALLRAASKNFDAVTVVCDPSDYSWISEKLTNREKLSERERLKLAIKAFKLTATYDTIIASALNTLTVNDSDNTQEEEDNLIFLNKIFTPRYGENPHQKAYVYSKYSTIEHVENPEKMLGLLGFEQLQGKQLSYNNILDTQVAAELVSTFANHQTFSRYVQNKPTAVLLKHQIPCGVAIGETLTEAFKKAFAGDPISPFGGIFAFNREIDRELAEKLTSYFFEVLIAPDISPEAAEILSTKKNLRILIGNLNNLKGKWDIKNAGPIVLLQETDKLEENIETEIVTEKKPTNEEMQNLLFAYNVARTIKSNGIVLAHDMATVGIGSGQPNRVGALKLALTYRDNMENPPKKYVMASDGFFPFADSVTIAAETGCTAIIQPGGSIRDKESIQEANKHGIAMVFTGVRHFKH